MKKIILINKKEGQTPLEAIQEFKLKNTIYKSIPMTYAGRLDPMAKGLLLVLAGEKNKDKEKYLLLDKEYKFEILFGFSTDTYDILGKINSKKGNFNAIKTKKELEEKIKNNIKFFIGNFLQTYPLYSSKTVNGIHLFEYARKNKKVEAPKRKVSVESLKLIKIKKINNLKLLNNIEKRVSKVKGDFRQKEILKIWRKYLDFKNKKENFFIASFEIKCGGGTYVRSISNSLGERIGVPALAFSIQRTKIGKYCNI